ncbi:PhzF family phenazine biosynthesis isomerase [Catenulispora subtropica]|uniref:PhzF family phenazine biosynthesis isomerase n=1 Tax=Catenulispora subtropica TaxID=450798 RepID=A0ABP5EFM5_9ACTN
MDILRYTAFTTDPSGGNPAGVVLDAQGVDDAAMLAAAAEVGYSETAFVFPPGPDGRLPLRFFSPLAEVSFCGHATIATAVAYAERHGTGDLTFETMAGTVPVRTAREEEGGAVTATLVSVPPRQELLAPATLAALLDALRWTPEDLDPAFPPLAAYGGAWHPIIAAADRERLARLDYAMDDLGPLMAEHGWTTVDLVWRESPTVFHARNPFPPGGVYEDPATGAAAAAFGGYLRTLGLVEAPATVTVHQGFDMGRPSTLTVGIPEGPGGISVTGTAVALG